MKEIEIIDICVIPYYHPIHYYHKNENVHSMMEKRQGGNIQDGKAKKRRVIKIEYHGLLKNGIREGLYKIIIHGDCDRMVMVSSFVHGMKEGDHYLYLEKSGKLLYYSLMEKNQSVREMDLSENETSTGIIDFEDGSRWEGDICMERACGQGEEYSDTNLLQYKGMEVNNRYEGYGTKYHLLDDELLRPIREYEGEWCAGIKHGKGSTFDLNGDLLQSGLWVNGQLMNIHCQISGCSNEFVCYSRIETLSIASESYTTATELNLSKCECLKEITIGDHSCRCVHSLFLEDMPELCSLSVGNNSFTECSSTWESHRRCAQRATEQGKTLRIRNCPKLVSITLGLNSFSDYVDFQLKDCSSLSSIRLGKATNQDEEESMSFCFFHSTCFILSNLPSLIHVTIGNSSFFRAEYVAFQNLPSLEIIHFGSYSCYGNDLQKSECNCVELLHLPNLTHLKAFRKSFYTFIQMTVDDIPNLCNSKFIRLYTSSFNYMNRLTRGNDVADEFVRLLHLTYENKDPYSRV